MNVRPFRIASWYILPGVVVRVRVLGREDTTEGAPLGEDDADWDYDPARNRALIRIAKDLPKRQRRYLLLHELQHALTDLLHNALTQGIVQPPAQRKSRCPHCGGVRPARGS